MSAGRLLAKVRPPVTEGNLFSWGQDAYYQFGAGAASTNSPVQIGAASDWSKIAIANHSLIVAKGKLWAAGANDYGQVGNGTVANPYAFVQIGAATDWTQVAAATSPYTTYGVSGALRSGKLFMWGGGGGSGQGVLGLGDQSQRSSPTQVGSETDWTFVSVSSMSAAGLRGGKLFTWGHNGNGQLGLGDTTSRSSPTQVGSETDWTWISIGDVNSFGIRGGKLFAWGSDGYGSLGRGTSGVNQSSPVQVGSRTDWTVVANDTGGGFSCSGIAGGMMFSWGSNSYGDLGLGDTTARNVPVQVGAATDWTMVKRGIWNYVCAFRGSKLFAWGLGSQGNLGDGTYNSRSSPVQIGAMTNWLDVAVGSLCTLGIKY